MVIKRMFTLSLTILMSSCLNYYVKKNTNKETNIDLKLYSFSKKLSIEDNKLIDTSAIYLEINTNTGVNNFDYNPEIILFHNDGFFESKSKKYFHSSINKRKKNSVYYGGKFILQKNDLMIESFYPSSGSNTNYFIKEISKGKVINDSIVLTIFGVKKIYLKKKYRDVFPR
jgi:hypothetical protein